MEQPEQEQEQQSEMLSQGLLGMWQPMVAQLQDTLHEIVESQEELVARVSEESSNVATNKALEEVALVMSQVPTYTQKLVQIRKDMVSLHEKSNRMKKRAEKLALQQSTQAQRAAQQAEQERQRERRLQARPVEDVLPTQPAAIKKKTKKRTSTSSATSTGSTPAQDRGIIVVNPGPKAATTTTTNTANTSNTTTANTSNTTTTTAKGDEAPQ
ncbi:hypothetical protein PTSG_00986 [Salpingoeca rosetta]|uniref:Biogenesis of lysosome-related organelles complex 1 subunit 6 n=1 Tax=Salpingoeca rosetta (strain ATCC 50818 / BSB-021) TaxID=946362 RepID=F2TY24_SALR5|nr:uncharacterized protein PTSG_00986 [Salpingoeca rosetta]EGD76283.1 hypothetical protein PTSG_00986 [Salpingoeca rosetta]|eukprot:XP_004998458.1 hypothetical protein PTSG_00986 [Salpingoeca rosetta]